MSLNNVTLMGRLAADPELKTTQSGVSVTSFSIAVDRKYQPKGEEKKADFIDCVAWRSTADFICKYFQKGTMIGIEGEIQTRTYQDKDGKNRKATEILVANVSFCGSKSESGSQQDASKYQPAAYTNNDTAQFETIASDEDLPF